MFVSQVSTGAGTYTKDGVMTKGAYQSVDEDYGPLGTTTDLQKNGFSNETSADIFNNSRKKVSNSAMFSPSGANANQATPPDIFSMNNVGESVSPIKLNSPTGTVSNNAGT